MIARGTSWIVPVAIGIALVLLSIAGYAGSRLGSLQANLSADPLAWRPFYVSGVVALRRGDTARGETLLREALHRDPRAPAVRLALLRQALTSGASEAAFRQLDQLYRLDPATATAALDALAATVDTAPHADQALAALRPYPALLPAFLRGLIVAGKPPQLIADFCLDLPDAALADDTLRALVVDQLVRAGHYDEARQRWAHYRAAASAAYVVDADFAAADALPPFGWQLASGPFGAAARARGGLDLVAYGRADGIVAGQLLTLGPGAYVIRLDYRAQGGDAGALALRVRCADGAGTLGLAPLGAGDGPARVAMTIEVPPGHCTGQYLEFVAGRVGDGDFLQQVRLMRIDVRPEAEQ